MHLKAYNWVVVVALSSTPKANSSKLNQKSHLLLNLQSITYNHFCIERCSQYQIIPSNGAETSYKAVFTVPNHTIQSERKLATKVTVSTTPEPPSFGLTGFHADY
ncbi:hypothetical protein Hdeb2414_s0008g00288251 [Helianthus debilis subsp. tardiflorus]